MQVTIAGLCALALAACAGAEGKVRARFEASGDTAAVWTSFRRSATYVTTKDGTRLAVDVVVPAGYTGAGTAPSKFPVVFQYTPYGRSRIDPKTGEVSVFGESFVRHGYATVVADTRGGGASFGWQALADPQIRVDGGELIDWIVAQPWSDGNVGMIGGSYVGWTQLAAASQKRKALKAIVPTVTGWFDAPVMHPGGIYSYAFMQRWAAIKYHLDRGSVYTQFPHRVAPVSDEDGDGELLDEIPVDLDGDGLFHDDYPWPLSKSGPLPRYPDGVARQRHDYFNAIMEHHAHPGGAPGSFDGDRVLSSMRFWDERRPGDGLTHPDLAWGFVPDVMASGVAVLTMAAWFDPFVRADFEIHSTIASAGTNPARIVATPTYHQGVSPAFAEHVGADSMVTRLRDTETLRWFDRWLKGIDNGIDREPRVQLFVMNQGWRQYKSWPVPGTVSTKWYLQGSRVLAETAPAGAGGDRYVADFTHYSGWEPGEDTGPIALVNAAVGKPAPVMPRFLRNRQYMFSYPDGPPVRTTLDKAGLTYTTAPLDRDTDVIGHPIVKIWASSTADYGDFFFYLEDVDPNGQAVLVTDYQHRAEFARLRNNDEMIPGNRGIDVKPDLPWHGFKRADYVDRVFANGAVVEIVTSLFPTAWRFKRGHSIRLTITAADWPTFELHPKLAPNNRATDRRNIVPTITIHRGGDRASYIGLPIVPAE